MFTPLAQEEEGISSEDLAVSDVETDSGKPLHRLLIQRLLYQVLPVVAFLVLLAFVVPNLVASQLNQVESSDHDPPQQLAAEIKPSKFLANDVLDPCGDLHKQCASGLKFVTVDICPTECKDPCTSIGRCVTEQTIVSDEEEDGKEEGDDDADELEEHE